jgi:excisionase family DNA binding protein
VKRIKLDTGIEIETPFLSFDEAAAYCGMSRKTFEKMVHDKNIPCTRLSMRVIRFHCDVLEECLKKWGEEYEK